jgi:hypothetical protein
MYNLATSVDVVEPNGTNCCPVNAGDSLIVSLPVGAPAQFVEITPLAGTARMVVAEFDCMT